MSDENGIGVKQDKNNSGRGGETSVRFEKIRKAVRRSDVTVSKVPEEQHSYVS